MPGTGIRARVVLLVAYAVAGGLLGFALSSIPSPHSVTVFWVGNFSSPWPVLAFFAGRSQRSWIWAVCTGAVAEMACVFGFYGRFLSLDPTHFDLPRSTTWPTVLATSLSHWAAFIAPWVLVALLTGLLYGALGAWWARSRSVVAGLALGLPFLVEPLLWPLRDGHFKGPLVVWVSEVTVGLLVLTVMASSSRRAEPGPIRSG